MVHQLSKSQKEIQKAAKEFAKGEFEKELAYELDNYPSSVYFQQAAYGVPIRMALMALLLGATQLIATTRDTSFVDRTVYGAYKAAIGVRCPNPNCISNQERERRNILPEFKMLKIGKPLTLMCAYCEHEVHPRYIASADWHEGRLENKKYHRADSHLIEKIKPENLIIFDSEKEAEAHGFRPSAYARVRDLT